MENRALGDGHVFLLAMASLSPQPALFRVLGAGSPVSMRTWGVLEAGDGETGATEAQCVS